MTTAIQPYVEVQVKREVWDETAGDWVSREIAVAVPAHFPAARRAIFLKAATLWNAPELLRWLTDLPVYTRAELVIVSRAHVIHRLSTDCLARQQSGPDPGTVLEMAAAIAEFVDDNGKRITPRPCRTCYATGLLVALEEVSDGRA